MVRRFWSSGQKVLLKWSEDTSLPIGTNRDLVLGIVLPTLDRVEKWIENFRDIDRRISVKYENYPIGQNRWD